MDEFNELDKEIEKLKAELSVQDEWARQFQAPAPGDYWRRRLDEEKTLWQKKLQVGEEEKKAMEAKYTSQQAEISAYNQKISEIEKKFDLESRVWEDRLKTKEAELLMEKNRVMWEDKIRESEFENRNFLQQIAGLNADISKLKDEHAADKKKLEEEFGREKNAYHERIKTNVDSLQILQERILELEGRLNDRQNELAAEKNRHESDIAVSREEYEKTIGENDFLKKEKRTLEEEISRGKQKTIEDKVHVEYEFNAVSKSFVDSWRKSLGAVVGMVRFMKSRRAARSTWNVLGEMLNKIEGETELLAAQAGVKPGVSDSYTAGIIAPDDEIAVWTKILSGTPAGLRSADRKQWKKEISQIKPRIMIISAKYCGLAGRISGRWPFVPVIIFGDLKPGMKKKALLSGYSVIASPSTDSETFETLNSAAVRSASYPEYWDKIRAKRPLAAPLAAVAALAIVAAAGYLYPLKPSEIFAPAKTASFVTPYVEPTNVTYDGQNLWACDWYGQSIYKHKLNGELGISRIFYFQNKHFSALAWMGGNLWSADALDQKIYKHNPDDNLTVIASFPSPGPAPSGLAGNGKFLWSCDAATAKIYKHVPDKILTVEREYPAPGSNPSGLYYDGVNLWSTDSKTNRIYCHRIDEDLTVIGTYIPPGYEQKGFNLSGITGSGKYFWVCSEKAGKIYQYPADLFAKSE
ncbi:MAG: hypothetical protein ABII64_08035 [Elusimicrobiota bacterium]